MNRMTHKSDFGPTVQLLDRDHRELSDLLAELNHHVAQESAQDLQLRLLKDLRRLSMTHFALEEGMMCATNYPGLAAHRSRHRMMVGQVQEFAANWSGRKFTKLMNSAGLLWESHVLHVENEDLGFGRWLNGESTPKLLPGCKRVDEFELIAIQ